MLSIKEILKKQYIGAIVIALLALQGVLAIIAVVLSPISLYLAQSRSVLYKNSSGPLFSPETLIPGIIRILLSLGTAYVLMRWLYLEKPQEGEPALSDEILNDQGEQS